MEFEENNMEEAVSLLLLALGNLEKATKIVKDPKLAKVVAEKMLEALTMAEQAKAASSKKKASSPPTPKPYQGLTPTPTPTPTPSPPSPAPSGPSTSTPGSSSSRLSGEFAPVVPPPSGGGTPNKGERLSKAELEVLRESSKINGNMYCPWDASDHNENFASSSPFSDPDGLLQLAQKQKNNFGGWKRPRELCAEPKMIEHVSPLSITQDVIADCSFVASLCITSAYQRKFKRQLITTCIFPKDRHGRPAYNPYGKYVIKLHYNGVPRKVVVDDQLPCDKYGRLMCTYSTNSAEFWPSIIEKAYMKLNGGYNFPGSNSSIDLYSLTGWIPEQIFFDDKADRESTWKRLMDGNKFGDVLITISTGEMAEERAEQLGLVPTHAYAVLDVRDVRGLRLLQVKNPWAHKRWTGAYSHLDQKNWTPELRKELNFDQLSAIQNDNGIFWIDWGSVLGNYASVHLNWNPELLHNHYNVHLKWQAQAGPRKDHYMLGSNPQFSFEARATEDNTPVWLLLSKHITKKEENRDFISLLVYPPVEGPNGEPKRVYYPDDPLIKGFYINSPHYLVRFNVPKGVTRRTLVISQVEKVNDLKVSLSAFSPATVVIRELVKPFVNETQLEGQWTAETAGGNSSHPGFYNNPAIRIRVAPNPSGRSRLLLTLLAPQICSGNIRLYRPAEGGGLDRGYAALNNPFLSSGTYRYGFCCMEADNLEGTEFVAMVSTYESGQRQKFIFGAASDRQVTIEALPAEGDGLNAKLVGGDWVQGVNNFGCSNHGRYEANQKYLLNTGTEASLTIRLSSTIQPTPSMNVTIFSRPSPGTLGPEVANSGTYTNPPYGVLLRTAPLPPAPHGYVVVISTYTPTEGPFTLRVFSKAALSLQDLKTL